MVNIEIAVIAKLKKGDQEFEILVDLEPALKLKRGERIDMHEVLAAAHIFKNAHKGDIAANLKEAFGTDEVDEIAREIIIKGDIQITMAYKKKKIEEKKN